MIMETKTTQCHPKPVVNATCLLGEKGCYKNGKCHYIGNCEHKVLTNADRIRAMSDEELAKLLLDADQGNFTVDLCDERFCDLGNCNHDCTAAALKWLKQPADTRGEEE
jgi:hypothetical protein